MGLLCMIVIFLGSNPVHFTAGLWINTNSSESANLPPIYETDFVISGHTNHRNLTVLEFGNLNINDENGNSPIHHAVKDGNETAVWMLVKSGVDLNPQNINGSTPLHIAVERGFENIFKHLMKYHADYTATDDHGNTPLNLATKQGHDRIAAIFNKIIKSYGYGKSYRERDSFVNRGYRRRRGRRGRQTTTTTAATTTRPIIPYDEWFIS